MDFWPKNDQIWPKIGILAKYWPFWIIGPRFDQKPKTNAKEVPCISTFFSRHVVLSKVKRKLKALKSEYCSAKLLKG